jgi:hypothetical protein
MPNPDLDCYIKSGVTPKHKQALSWWDRLLGRTLHPWPPMQPWWIPDGPRPTPRPMPRAGLDADVVRKLQTVHLLCSLGMAVKLRRETATLVRDAVADYLQRHGAMVSDAGVVIHGETERGVADELA